ncbi:MAG TPA: protein kinase [Streptosporangiaceae bacterium]|jgi:outer membrane protein assembly factor BamB
MREASTGWRVPGLTELAVLGSGAQGRVVLARSEDSGTTVAVKYLTMGPLVPSDARGTFRTEAEMLQRVDNPHIARLLRYVEEEDGAAIVMEAVNGVSLRKVLDRNGPLGPEAALFVLKGALLGLAAAHGVGVVHRDFKPANVVVEENGNSKLIDFGIAVLTGQGDRSGTPTYMAPEQWAGEPASPATDLYSATCVFFECVTGRRPYEGSDTETLRTQHTEAPVPVADVPEPLQPLIAKGLAKSPAGRLWDAGGFVTELESVAAEAYGPSWERRGQIALAASAAALSSLFPAAVLGGKGLLAKLLGAKAGIGSGATATAGVVLLALLFWPADKPMRPAWDVVGMVPASSIVRVDGGFALYVGSQGGGFEMISLEERTGKVRWRQPANPSYIRAVSGLSFAEDNKTVIFMRPVGAGRTRLVEVVALDAKTGARRWVYGSQGIRVISEPHWCQENKLCLTRRNLETGTEDARILDAATGKELADSAPVDGRELGSQLYASPDLTELMRIMPSGKEVWRRSVKELFGTDRLDLQGGWDVDTDGRRYLVDASGEEAYSKDGHTYFFNRAITVGLDLETGRPLWREPGANRRCGSVASSFDHPVRCRATASETFHGTAPSTYGVDDVTIEGFDPVTGKTRWSWHAGPVRGLVADDSSVLQLNDTTYAVRNSAGLHLLDLDKGVRPIGGPAPIGWCVSRGFIRAAQPPADGEERGYAAWWTSPCAVTGKQVRLPQTTPEFAGARSGNVFAWVDRAGVHAVFVR